MPKKEAEERARATNRAFACNNPIYQTTITEARKAAEVLGKIGLPVISVYLIPNISDGGIGISGDVEVSQAIQDYNVDPDTDLVDVYFRFAGTGTNGHVAALIMKRMEDMTQTGTPGFVRLYQMVYPGANALEQMIALKPVQDAIRDAFRKL